MGLPRNATHSLIHRFSSITAFKWILVSLWLILPAHCPAPAVAQGSLEADFCDHLPAGFYPYPYDCAAYISCYEARPQLRFCADGKLFNRHLQICDTPDSVDCAEAGIPNPDPQCVDAANGVVLPSSEQCDEFIVCLDHQAVAQKCPEHFLFNPILLICDEPGLVVCYGDSTTDATTTTRASTSTAMPTTEGYNECAGQEIGTSFPYPADCQQYILCLGNDEYVKAQCPVNAWYDPKTGTCGPDVPKTACQLVDTTSTTAATTPGPQQLCADQKLGVSYPLLTDCRKYIMCLGNGESAIVDCIYNSWYDPAIGDCGQDVSPTACQSDARPTTTTAEPTTEPTIEPPTTAATASTHPPIDLDICAGLQPGQYTSYPDYCSKYIVCAEPVPIAFYCTPGYFFNEARQQCVDWALSDCGSGGTTVEPPTEPGICLDKEGHTFPYTENCQWYIRCVDDHVYMIGVCDPGEYFDPLIGECGSGVSPDACLTGYITTTLTTTTSASTSTTTTATTALATAAPVSPQPDDDPCAGVPVGALVPYPNDCTKFIQCICPGPVVWDCVEGQEFSAALQRCMAPWYANCTFMAATTAPPSPTTELPDPDDFCSGKPDGSLVPYPDNCSKYIVCREPIAVGYDCPAGEEFSPTTLRCMPAELAQCSARTRLLF